MLTIYTYRNRYRFRRYHKIPIPRYRRTFLFEVVFDTLTQWRTEGGSIPPSKFRTPSKIVPNSTRLWKLLKIAEFRTPTHQGVRKKGSKILKLPSVRNCFTLAMTNKLVVIINSLKVPKIKKMLLYEMKFLVPNYSCLHNPWLGGYCHQIPVLNWTCWTPPPPPPEQNSWVRHCLDFCMQSQGLCVSVQHKLHISETYQPTRFENFTVC